MRGALLNVGDIETSIDFYTTVFGLKVISRADQVATLISRVEHQGHLILRGVETHRGFREGRNTIGPVALLFEASSEDEFGQIQKRLDQRSAVSGHRRAEGWQALFGTDPDRIQFAVIIKVGIHKSWDDFEMDLGALAYVLDS